MAYKCSQCSFIDVNAQDTPDECVSCGAVASMEFYDYQPKTPVNHVTTADAPDDGGIQEGLEDSEEGTLGSVFGE